jgi:hypothetical protein
MFKYIADIIAKISIKQRLLALGIVLSTIVIISVAPKLINGLTQDNEELELKVESQRNMIVRLNQRMGELNDQILENQTVCTNRFIDREREILVMLTQMEDEASKTHNRVVSTQTQRIESPRIIIDENESEDPDIPRVARMMRMPEPTTTTVVVNDNSKMLKMLKGIKNNVENEIKEKGSK